MSELFDKLVTAADVPRNGGLKISFEAGSWIQIENQNAGCEVYKVVVDGKIVLIGYD